MPENTKPKPKPKIEIESHKDPASLRCCLLCSEKFSSAGPHNRICKRCKSGQVWRQG